ncbi:MAG: cation transporter, partial [Parvibaculaceae bacterium]|nr:cation transporter [Parvibaculaceae bacterium]
GNLAVIFAASGVWATSSAWPDLIVAGVMASLFLWSSIQIISQALGELRISQNDQEVVDVR